MYFQNLYRRGPDRAFDERGWRHQDQARWEAAWHKLPVPARRVFLQEVKAAARPEVRTRPSVSAERFPPEQLKELTDAGLVEVQGGAKPKGAARVFVPNEALDFVSRLRCLQRNRLLTGGGLAALPKYVQFAYYQYPLMDVVQGVLRKAGVAESCSLSDFLHGYVSYYRWPEWAAASLNDPLAGRVLAAVEGTEAPVPRAELPQRIPGATAERVRSALQDLLGRLALVEDLDRDSLELVVGLLPAVRKALAEARKPRTRPPLEVCEAPSQLGPDGGPAVNDLRAFLLEIAAEPPRLRQDHSFYQKEVGRFLDGMEPLPEWLSSTLSWSPEKRLNQAGYLANKLQLVVNYVEDKEVRMHLSDKGRKWLAATLESQCAGLFGPLQSLDRDSNYYGAYYPGDAEFLGLDVTALPIQKGGPSAYWNVKPEQRRQLRDALFRSFAELPVGVFYRLESFLAHAAFDGHNPLLLGQPPEKVTVYLGGVAVPPLPEHREQAGRRCLETLVRERLIPFGGLRTAVDDQGRLCIARHPRLDQYFGQEAVPTEWVEEAAGAPRVIVQPDFSVVIIGLNPAPAAELAPFCERRKGHAGQGSLVLKITRDAVVKAITHGLEPAEVLARLERHATNELPANVRHEVREWCAWVRQVKAESLTVIRCPDRETADRVAGALGRQAERLNDRVVAIPVWRLSTADRNKLQKQGIIVQRKTGSD
jgi:hypothetical protein